MFSCEHPSSNIPGIILMCFLHINNIYTDTITRYTITVENTHYKYVTITYIWYFLHIANNNGQNATFGFLLNMSILGYPSIFYFCSPCSPAFTKRVMINPVIDRLECAILQNLKLNQLYKQSYHINA